MDIVVSGCPLMFPADYVQWKVSMLPPPHSTGGLCCHWMNLSMDIFCLWAQRTTRSVKASSIPASGALDSGTDSKTSFTLWLVWLLGNNVQYSHRKILGNFLVGQVSRMLIMLDGACLKVQTGVLLFSCHSWTAICVLCLDNRDFPYTHLP